MKTLVLLMLAAGAFAQQPDYFPLQAGNQWVYRVTGFGGTSSLVLEVTGERSLADRAYFELSGLPAGPVLVRTTGEGRLVVFNPLTGGEATWVDFSAAQGAPFPSGIDPCSTQAAVDSRAAHVETPIGAFDNALAFRYSGRCADAGIESDIFLPWIGLVRRTEQTIGGPRTYSLIYVALGGVTFAAEPQLSFSLGVTKRTARITLRNTQPNPVTLAFPSGQDFDLVLKDRDGNVVYRWSAGKVFPAIFRTPAFSGEKNWVVTIPDSVPDGRYTAEAALSTSPPGQFTATAPVEVER